MFTFISSPCNGGGHIWLTKPDSTPREAVSTNGAKIRLSNVLVLQGKSCIQRNKM
jgi:hypothetical protein